MERAICELGIVPFFTSAIPGYSIKELTQPGFWFDGEEDSLGPWDWKIDCGIVAYEFAHAVQGLAGCGQIVVYHR